MIVAGCSSGVFVIHPPEKQVHYEPDTPETSKALQPVARSTWSITPDVRFVWDDGNTSGDLLVYANQMWSFHCRQELHPEFGTVEHNQYFCTMTQGRCLVDVYCFTLKGLSVSIESIYDTSLWPLGFVQQCIEGVGHWHAFLRPEQDTKHAHVLRTSFVQATAQIQGPPIPEKKPSESSSCSSSSSNKIPSQVYGVKQRMRAIFRFQRWKLNCSDMHSTDVCMQARDHFQLAWHRDYTHAPINFWERSQAKACQSEGVHTRDGSSFLYHQTTCHYSHSDGIGNDSSSEVWSWPPTGADPLFFRDEKQIHAVGEALTHYAPVIADLLAIDRQVWQDQLVHTLEHTDHMQWRFVHVSPSRTVQEWGFTNGQTQVEYCVTRDVRGCSSSDHGISRRSIPDASRVFYHHSQIRQEAGHCSFSSEVTYFCPTSSRSAFAFPPIPFPRGTSSRTGVCEAFSFSSEGQMVRDGYVSTITLDSTRQIRASLALYDENQVPAFHATTHYLSNAPVASACMIVRKQPDLDFTAQPRLPGNFPVPWCLLHFDCTEPQVFVAFVSQSLARNAQCANVVNLQTVREIDEVECVSDGQPSNVRTTRLLTQDFTRNDDDGKFVVGDAVFSVITVTSKRKLGELVPKSYDMLSLDDILARHSTATNRHISTPMSSSMLNLVNRLTDTWQKSGVLNAGTRALLGGLTSALSDTLGEMSQPSSQVLRQNAEIITRPLPSASINWGCDNVSCTADMPVVHAQTGARHSIRLECTNKVQTGVQNIDVGLMCVTIYIDGCQVLYVQWTHYRHYMDGNKGARWCPPVETLQISWMGHVLNPAAAAAARFYFDSDARLAPLLAHLNSIVFSDDLITLYQSLDFGEAGASNASTYTFAKHVELIDKCQFIRKVMDYFDLCELRSTSIVALSIPNNCYESLCRRVPCETQSDQTIQYTLHDMDSPWIVRYQVSEETGSDGRWKQVCRRYTDKGDLNDWAWLNVSPMDPTGAGERGTSTDNIAVYPSSSATGSSGATQLSILNITQGQRTNATSIDEDGRLQTRTRGQRFSRRERQLGFKVIAGLRKIKMRVEPAVGVVVSASATPAATYTTVTKRVLCKAVIEIDTEHGRCYAHKATDKIRVQRGTPVAIYEVVRDSTNYRLIPRHLYEPSVCNICTVECAEFAHIPCGHAICDNCYSASMEQSTVCAFCRQTVESVVEVDRAALNSDANCVFEQLEASQPPASEVWEQLQANAGVSASQANAGVSVSQANVGVSASVTSWLDHDDHPPSPSRVSVMNESSHLLAPDTLLNSTDDDLSIAEPSGIRLDELRAALSPSEDEAGVAMDQVARFSLRKGVPFVYTKNSSFSYDLNVAFDIPDINPNPNVQCGRGSHLYLDPEHFELYSYSEDFA